MTHHHITPHHIGRASAADSPAVRAIADRIAAGRHELAQRIVDRFREEIADYRLLDDEQVFADMLAFTLDNLEALTSAAIGRLEGDPGKEQMRGRRTYVDANRE